MERSPASGLRSSDTTNPKSRSARMNGIIDADCAFRKTSHWGLRNLQL